MKSTESKSVNELVERLKEIQKHSGITIPSWMLDENRYGESPLTLQEQHEWAETICRSMRSTEALQYLIECEKRWGLRDGECQFKTGEFVFGLTQELIENLLIEHVEGALIEQKPQERYLAVFQFYYANDQRLKEGGKPWFKEFLDEMFESLAVRLRAGEMMSVKPIVH